MLAINFTLELLEPMLATAPGGDQNTEVSLDYVPGGVLRGALIGRYLRRHNRHELSLGATEQSLFFSSAVCYLNAYPVIGVDAGIDARTMPVPLSWNKRKDASESDSRTEVRDLSISGARQKFGDAQIKNLSNPFFAFNRAGDIVVVKPKRTLAVHTEREPHKGRALEEKGALFRYEAVASGTRFGATIFISDETNEDSRRMICDLLDGGELSLGGSRTGGYGRAQVTNIEHAPQRSAPQAIEKNQFVRITLLSDALLRDGRGQHQAHLSASYLSSRLGALTICEDLTFKSAVVVGGFNRKWGLPLPQKIAVKAGSVFTFKAESDVTEAQLKKLLDEGLGERRAEGFGRIAVNLNGSEQLRLAAPKSSLSVPVALHSASGREMARIMIERILRRRFDEILVKKIGLCRMENQPPNSQIARLRGAVLQALRDNRADTVKEFFERNESIARRHYERAMVTEDTKKMSLSDWVTQSLDKVEGLDAPDLSLGGGAEPVKAGSEAILLEYRLRFIDGVLAWAAKSDRAGDAAEEASSHE